MCRRTRRRARDYDDDFVVKPPTKRSRRAPAKEADADHMSDDANQSGVEEDELAEWADNHKVCRAFGPMNSPHVNIEQLAELLFF